MSTVQQGWALVDVLALGVLLISVLLGVIRGLTKELLSLAGWVVAYFSAQWLAPVLEPMIPVGAPDSMWRSGSAWLAAFVGVWLLWAVTAWMISQLIKASPLAPLDRLGGALFGAARAVVLGVAAATLVLLAGGQQKPWWQSSAVAPWLESSVRVLSPLLPERMARSVSAPEEPSRDAGLTQPPMREPAD